MNAENKEPRRRLPFWRTIIDSYVVTYSNLGYLARLSWAWVLLMIPISLAFYALMFWLGWHQAPEGTFGSIFIIIASSLLFSPMIASIAVAWHRRLLENESWLSGPYLRLDRVVANYFNLVFLASLLILAPAAGLPSSIANLEAGDADLFSLVLVLGYLIAMGVGTFVATRIWLALPARALDRDDVTVKSAWTITRGCFWRLFWGSVLCVLPVIIATSALTSTTFGVVDVEDTTLARYAVGQTLLGFFAAFLGGMPAISFLSLTYRWLVMDGKGELQEAN